MKEPWKRSIITDDLKLKMQFLILMDTSLKIKLLWTKMVNLKVQL